MDDNLVDIFIENEDENETFLLECRNEISYAELRKILNEKNLIDMNYFYIIYKGIIYGVENEYEIINLEDGDKILLKNERTNEGWSSQNFNKNINDIDQLNGLLKIIPLKNILFIIYHQC